VVATVGVWLPGKIGSGDYRNKMVTMARAVFGVGGGLVDDKGQDDRYLHLLQELRPATLADIVSGASHL
jgi:hypothetical protein